MVNKCCSVVLFFFANVFFGQQKITVDNLYKSAFREQTMSYLQSLKNTNQYAFLNFVSLKKMATIINSKYFMTIKGIDSCLFDTAEKPILIAYNTYWRVYDCIYKERYMQNSLKNPSGYVDNSLRNYKSKLLHIHGS